MERPRLPEIAIPSFGYTAHTSIDRHYRLIPCWEVTDASRHDGHLLRQGLLDPTNTGAAGLADTALSLAAERDVPGAPRVHQPYPPAPPAWPTTPGTRPPRQCQALAGPGSGRTRVRGTETSHGTDRPHDRYRPGANEDRDGQSCLQPPAASSNFGAASPLDHPRGIRMPASSQRRRCNLPNTPIDARITANETQNGRFRLAEPHNAWLFEAPRLNHRAHKMAR